MSHAQGITPPRAALAGPALAGLAIGALVASVLLPALLPAWIGSLTGDEPKAYWYLSRASGLTAYGLVWLSVVTGLLQSSGIARGLFDGPAIYGVHRHAAWSGLAFATFHAVVLLGDRYLGGSLATIAVPFAMSRHAPGWVGLGQLGLYLGLAVAVSFRLRGRIGARTWRALHFASFTVFALVLAHAALAGSDRASPWIAAYYASTGGLVAALTLVRALRERARKADASLTE